MDVAAMNQERVWDLVQEYRRRTRGYLWMAIVAVPVGFFVGRDKVLPPPDCGLCPQQVAALLALVAQFVLVGLAGRSVNLLIDYKSQMHPRPPRDQNKKSHYLYEWSAYILLLLILWSEFSYLASHVFLWYVALLLALVAVVVCLLYDYHMARGPQEWKKCYCPFRWEPPPPMKQILTLVDNLLRDEMSSADRKRLAQIREIASETTPESPP